MPMSPSLTRLARLALFTFAATFAAGLGAAEPAKAAPLALPAPSAALPFAHEGSDLKPDPAVRFGKLPNGVRYAVTANKEPKGRASLRLLVLAGSFQETEEQRGVAHFLEHMAFNGSTHYAPGTLVEFFQRMGMSFGGDTNASTSFDRTLYLLELAHTDPATLAEGLRVFGDYAGGLLLNPEEINKERGIILSEKRVRDSVGFRTMLAQFDFMLGETLLPKRLPIGTTEVITGAPRERFVEFWNAWYRPEKIAVIAVGDFDAAAVEQQIVAQFGSLTARAPALSAPDLGKITPFTGIRAKFHAEPEAPATSVSITGITPYTPEPDTIARNLRQLPRSLALGMLNRRFAELAKKEGAPFDGASASASEAYDILLESSVDLSCKPTQWAAALAVGEQELRRALEHGFTAAELKEVVAGSINRLEQAVKRASTRPSSSIAGELAQSILGNDVYTSPEYDLATFKPAYEKVTVADCLAALRSAFAAPGRYIFVSGNATIPGDAAAAIAAAYEKSRATPVAAPAAEQAAAWAYTDFGPAGKVVKRETVADLGIELVTFANGVRLNLKKTDFEAGRIRLNARVGNGSITEPANQRGLAALAGATFGAGGLGKHSTDDLRRIFAGKNAGSQFRIGPDAFGFGGGTTRDDLLLCLQLMTAQITDAGWRPEAYRQAQKGLEQMYLGFAHTANGPLALEVANLLASGDPRFGTPPQAVLTSRTLAEARAWIAPQLATGALEVAAVGDLDVEATIAAVAQTLGALPAREARPALTELKKISFPAEPFTKDYTIDTKIPKGSVNLYWPTTDALDPRRSRRLNLLGLVFNDRLRVKVREEVGGTYSPNAGSSASDTFPGYGYFRAAIDVEPAKAAELTALVISIADDLATKGVTPEELERARKPLMTSLTESLRDNGYWLGNVLSRAQEKPEVLDWARTRLADNESITAAELSELAAKYLGRARVSRATILPAAKTVPAN